jgi:hypothetical protein
MCWLADSVGAFSESNPAETPFGHSPFVCENRICPHYHTDGAEITDVADYGQGLTAYFECSHCGMRYKHKKSTDSREQRFIVDYGHIWLGELHRCCQDPKITNERTMEILKCGPQTLANQKKKYGLMKPIPNYMGMGPEAYYKAKVLEVCQEYDEVTIALLGEKAPGAYGYLQERDYEWIRSRVVFDNERRFRLEREKLLLTKLHEIIAEFDAEGYPDKVLSYGHIASLIGSTRDELRYKMSPNSELRVYLDGIIEHKATWRQERAAKLGEVYSYKGVHDDNINKHRPKRVCAEKIVKCLSQRETFLLAGLRKVIDGFESEGYPDKQLSYDLLAGLIDSTRSELRGKSWGNSELQVFLDEIVEHSGVWRQERAAKIGVCTSKRENILRNVIRQLWTAPPQQQISRKYIARVSGISRDVIEDNPYLSEMLNGVAESKEDWFKRRLTAAYYSKPIEGRPYSTWAIYRAASIDWSTYNRHRELFEEAVDDLNMRNE